ncbi:hypothetical protein [Azospirillum doebereinerae]
MYRIADDGVSVVHHALVCYRNAVWSGGGGPTAPATQEEMRMKDVLTLLVLLLDVIKRLLDLFR